MLNRHEVLVPGLGMVIFHGPDDKVFCKNGHFVCRCSNPKSLKTYGGWAKAFSDWQGQPAPAKGSSPVCAECGAAIEFPYVWNGGT